MKDVYHSFKSLAAAESEYRIIYEENSGSDRIVLSPHGGGIEPGVSELVRAFSDECSIYLFEGMKRRNNQALHVTSTRFNEPLALEKVKAHQYALSIHGYRDPNRRHTLVGGTDLPRAAAVAESLKASGFSAELVSDKEQLAGVHPMNIVNRSKKTLGVQLELSMAQRSALFDDFGWRERDRTKNEHFSRYVSAVKVAFCRE
ncbi:poly-gamma-glutamate hydrolase family protein [Bacillus atrophaeus]|uniref:poly-gamma-glutamate hydrolase family protein n=1 Tax=Bacillus atrophaeus TaxID=1452 RepID=UPI002E205AB6|nr:poly-gamma-glutamate hydrolase family protein [Bacillus atrophaeus]